MENLMFVDVLCDVPGRRTTIKNSPAKHRLNVSLSWNEVLAILPNDERDI